MKKKYAPIDWDEIKSKKVELPKFKNAKERSDFVAAMYKDADMMIDDEKILRNERTSIQVAERMANPEFRQEWDEKNKVGVQKRFDSVEWREQNKLAGQKRSNSTEWREKQKAGAQKRSDSTEWREKQKAGAQKRSDTVEWRESQKIAGQKRSDSVEWRESQKIAGQKRSDSVEWRENQKKAVCKSISCDGIIYSSKTEATLALAPVTRLSNDSKSSWLAAQLKKYPERYFYVDETGNKIEQPVNPKPVDPTYMSLEERKALAKLKRQQDNADK